MALFHRCRSRPLPNRLSWHPWIQTSIALQRWILSPDNEQITEDDSFLATKKTVLFLVTPLGDRKSTRLNSSHVD